MTDIKEKDNKQDVTLAEIATKLDGLIKGLDELKTDVKDLTREIHANNGLKSRLDKLEAKYNQLFKLVIWGVPTGLTALGLILSFVL